MTRVNKIDEQFLAAQIIAGNEYAFDFIFRKYYRLLCGVAVRYLKDDDLSQSIVQDCFVAFWEKRNELSDIKNLYSYLSFMVRNRAVDQIRKREANVRASANVSYADPVSVEEELISEEFEKKYREVVANLPERCRIAFEYSRHEGLKYTDIASKMNITVKAVEALVGRSLKILRTELSEYLPLLLLFTNFLKKM